MNVVVSNGKRVPKDLVHVEHEMWSLSEFVESASKGLDVSKDFELYVDLADIKENIYNAIIAYKEVIKIVFYTFEGDSKPGFNVDQSLYKEYTKDLDDEEFDSDEDFELEDEEESLEETSEVKQEAKVEVNKSNNQIVKNDFEIDQKALSTLLNQSGADINKSSNKPAKIVLFGSSKGGVGKTMTCLMTAYRYANKHKDQKIAVVDFDITDGQISVILNKFNHNTLLSYYKSYKTGDDSINALQRCIAKGDSFASNVDFYFSPYTEIEEVTDNYDFWKKVVENIISEYDVVFFDSGTDFIGKPPISMLYKIADYIFINCNPSINSTKSVIKQLQKLMGLHSNNVYKQEDNIISKVKVILTRKSNIQKVNEFVIQQLSNYAEVVTVFGKIDDEIEQIQYLQEWKILEDDNEVTTKLEEILKVIK